MNLSVLDQRFGDLTSRPIQTLPPSKPQNQYHAELVGRGYKQFQSPESLIFIAKDGLYLKGIEPTDPNLPYVLQCITTSLENVFDEHVREASVLNLGFTKSTAISFENGKFDVELGLRLTIDVCPAGVRIFENVKETTEGGLKKIFAPHNVPTSVKCVHAGSAWTYKDAASEYQALFKRIFPA